VKYRQHAKSFEEVVSDAIIGRPRVLPNLFMSSPSPQNEEEEGISDVDARVLREMLQESKLDLQTEEDVRKLLDRGVTKKVASNKPPSSSEGTGDEESMFQSELFQKFADTKMWRSVSAKTSDILESAKLWVENKIEQDVKTLAALGIFAWDRVVKDVSRALPAAGSTARKTIFLLTNSSSYEEPPPITSSSLREELNRPADEIKSVSQAIWDILNGNADGSGEAGRRGLRTVAKAGTANMADRQRRAFQQTRRKREDETGVKGISKIPGGIVDATYELKQELKAETNPAGYKTQPIRQAIEAGVVGTGKYLQAMQETARLAAAERKAKRLQASSPTTEKDNNIEADETMQQPSIQNPAPGSFFANVDTQMPTTKAETTVQGGLLVDFEEVLIDLQIERDAILNRLSACIRRPEETWLQSDLLTTEAKALTEESLREIATLMILLKDELNSTSTSFDEAETIDSCLNQLRMDLKFIEELRGTVAGTVSMPIGNALFDIIVGAFDVLEGENEVPLLLRLDEFEKSFYEPPRPPPVEPTALDPINVEGTSFAVDGDEDEVEVVASVVAKVIDDNDWTSDAESFKYMGVDAATATTNEDEPAVVVSDADMIDASVVEVIPEYLIRTEKNGPKGSFATIDEGDVAASTVVDADMGGIFMAEVVTDDAFDTAVGEQKAVASVVDEVEEEEEPNLALIVILRSFDIIFFLLEKLFVVAIPRSIQLASTAAKRWEEVNRNGMGKKGWDMIKNTADPKGRY